ncbi:hypothetical protein CRG98_006750 [Punica granatum]|uniref:Uncharacterized protein n=1 Tax=Punica granatum TaxID=22663 RepID=A0A2I0KWN5_PUNGR|nr:hypothetical protein CRG98_006750 [Punica granatum]
MLGCKGCMFGCAWTSAARVGTRGCARARGWAHGRATVRAGERLCLHARGWTRGCAGACGYEFTGHPRARSSSEMRKST